MKKYYDRIPSFEPVNKENELKIAKKFQKKLFSSKLIYYFIPFIAFYFLLDKIYGFNIKFSDAQLMWLIGIFWVAVLYSIISTLILGICPYCQRFQKLNGKAVGVDSTSISYTKGVSPFIKYCTRCGAPLSEKAVNEVYKKMAKDES
ncbi:hypothetical protein [Neisseria sp.]|uniref:hypothetical protein n=1 Tax=Neisseria sp. TaxID=192066 RepID=UPI0026DD5149|nr:hypothetical protein [Neisseria sp.]MDO4907523.1 hypothetical protein [Neisseria sp.]